MENHKMPQLRMLWQMQDASKGSQEKVSQNLIPEASSELDVFSDRPRHLSNSIIGTAGSAKLRF